MKSTISKVTKVLDRWFHEIFAKLINFCLLFMHAMISRNFIKKGQSAIPRAYFHEIFEKKYIKLSFHEIFMINEGESLLSLMKFLW